MCPRMCPLALRLYELCAVTRGGGETDRSNPPPLFPLSRLGMEPHGVGAARERGPLCMRR